MQNNTPYTNQNSSNRFLAIATIVVVAFIGIIAFLISTTINTMTASVELHYTPTSTTITIDGKPYTGDGSITVTPGNHEIIAEKYGFETQTISVDAPSGQTTPVYIILEPNTDFTTDWYTTHPDDAILAEGITGYRLEYNNKILSQKYPNLSKLPIRAANFQIYQTACTVSEVCIMIDASSAHRDEALKYFRQKIDKDSGRYYITFKDYYNPFNGEG